MQIVKRAFLLCLICVCASCGSGSSDSDSSSNETGATSKVTAEKITSTRHAFASLLSDDTVITWGRATSGGDSSSVQHLLVDIVDIFAGSGSFAALKEDGTVVTWGNNIVNNAEDVQSELYDIVKIVPGPGYAALRSDKTVITWGNSNSPEEFSIITGVEALVASAGSFSAIQTDGTVVSWGGLYQMDGEYGNYEEYEELAKDPVLVVSDEIGGYAAILADGDVVTWGHPTSIQNFDADRVKGATHIFSAAVGFVATFPDGRAEHWGLKWPQYRGAPPDVLEGVMDVVAGGFGNVSVLLSDGSVISWGSYGEQVGSFDERSWEQLYNFPRTLSDISKIYSRPNNDVFTAVDGSGNAYTWGLVSTENAGILATNVKDIVMIDWAVAALDGGGSVTYWGGVDGIERNQVTFDPLIESMLFDIKSIYASGHAFSAIKSDGTIITWGNYVDDGVVEFH
mgnify:CR=1 FL=1